MQSDIHSINKLLGIISKAVCIHTLTELNLKSVDNMFCIVIFTKDKKN